MTNEAQIGVDEALLGADEVQSFLKGEPLLPHDVGGENCGRSRVALKSKSKLYFYLVTMDEDPCFPVGRRKCIFDELYRCIYVHGQVAVDLVSHCEVEVFDGVRRGGLVLLIELAAEAKISSFVLRLI